MTRDEPRWQASLATLAIVALYVTLPPRITLGPLWLFPVLILVLLLPLSVLSPRRRNESTIARIGSIALIAVSTFFNVVSVALFVAALTGPNRGHAPEGVKILAAGVQMWLTNVLVFALWYWEVDAGGPEARAVAESAAKFKRADFEFPQMVPEQMSMPYSDPAWRPVFFDYLFLAFNTATAFSPTDTYPLTGAAKALMMAQSIVSLVTIAVIIGRSVNILS